MTWDAGDRSTFATISQWFNRSVSIANEPAVCGGVPDDPLWFANCHLTRGRERPLRRMDHPKPPVR
jgi:hypothetical protein